MPGNPERAESAAGAGNRRQPGFAEHAVDHRPPIAARPSPGRPRAPEQADYGLLERIQKRIAEGIHEIDQAALIVGAHDQPAARPEDSYHLAYRGHRRMQP